MGKIFRKDIESQKSYQLCVNIDRDIMKKSDRRVTKTQESICKAFSQLIQSKEYHNITVTDLANLANIDRKTFYLHYRSIDDLLKKSEDELLQKIIQLMQMNQPFCKRQISRHLAPTSAI